MKYLSPSYITSVAPLTRKMARSPSRAWSGIYLTCSSSDFHDSSSSTGVGIAYPGLGRRHHDREQAVVERVVAEDVGDLAGDHRGDAVVEQRPRCVLARGTAAEVAPGDEDRAAARLALVEREGGVVAAIGEVAPVVEAVTAQARARGGGEEARGDDAVGVDVVVGEHGAARVDAGHGVHAACSRRGSR